MRRFFHASCFMILAVFLARAGTGRAAALPVQAQEVKKPPAPASAEPGMSPDESFPEPDVLFEGFRVRAQESGYMKPRAFLAFLEQAPGRSGEREGLFSRGWMLGLLGILAGGILLNATPCVLPMIPVNLAIIGAGAHAASRRVGFLVGGAYGLAMALSYGVLGLGVVLTGSTFGVLNASPGFNAVIAVLFAVLALGMFDLLPIDFSRFQNRLATGKFPGGRLALAFGMGAVAALLAGACVAPVLISVLLLSADLYGKGYSWGLGLPFLLGLGMGLPWPFVGAGFSFLPKPGRWMVGVKYAFGVIIAILSLYYGHLAWRLSHPLPEAQAHPAEAVVGRESEPLLFHAATPAHQWSQALERARASNTPVLIDFWATWCKNCLVMDRTTFRDARVIRRMSEFMVIKYQAEQPNQSPTREWREFFGIPGLPTYVILDPEPSSHIP